MKWGTLLSMMDHSSNSRKKGGTKRGNKRWWEGSRRQVGSLHTGKTPYYCSQTQDRDFCCSRKWSEAQHSWGKELRKEPEVSQAHHKADLTHANELTFYLPNSSGTNQIVNGPALHSLACFVKKGEVRKDWWSAHSSVTEFSRPYKCFMLNVQ